MLDPDVHRRVLAAADAWARAHPLPDAAVLEDGEGRSYTPNEIARELRLGPDSLIWRMVELGIRTYSVEEVVDSFMAHGTDTGPVASIPS